MNKIRIKDIAKDLGIGQKELLHVLRELGIQVKSQMGTLSDEEAAQVRARVRESQTGRTQIIDTEVQPGVIVRRRKTAPAPAATPAPPEAAPEPAPAPEPVTATAPVAEEPEDEVDEALKGEAFPEFEEKEEEPAAREPKPTRPVILETARVIRPAVQEETPEPEPAAPEEPEAPVAQEPVAQAEAPEAAPAAPETPAATEAPVVKDEEAAAPAAPEAPTPAGDVADESRRAKPRRPEPAAPKVRIISMPDRKSTRLNSSHT